MPIQPENPIGIFDSGIGGLTVAQAVAHLLPDESMHYFGDTVHLPYGDKSTASIQAYSVKICEMLLQKNCKVILIACHSASAAAFELVHRYVRNRAKVINVIEPVIQHICEHYKNCHVGLIGTRQTVHSGIYAKKLKELNLGIKLSSLATPLLVPMIEEGFSNNKLSTQMIDMYLSSPILHGIDTLILGCTHYPLIKPSIQAYYKDQIEIIDAAELTATALKKLLVQNDLINPKKNSEKHFYVSELTASFAATTKLFFNQPIDLQYYPLWD